MDKSNRPTAREKEIFKKFAKDLESEKLVKGEQEVKVLENHKEKKKEQFIAEEKAAELKMFSELGVQRHFIRAREEAAENQEEET